MSFSSNLALPLPVCILTWLRRGWVNTIIKLFPWCYPGDDESILRIVTSIVDITILVIVNTTNFSVPDSCLKCQALCCYSEDPNEDGVHTPVMLPPSSIIYCCQMGKGSDAIENPNPCLHHSSGPTSPENICGPDTYGCLPHKPSFA
jgi:hypothetical protein